VDGPAARPLRRRQPHERIHSNPARADRARAPYDQDAWAPLPDSRLPIDVSLAILDNVHARWTAVWRSLMPAQFERRFYHPEIGLPNPDAQRQGYAWHSRHHVAHITSRREREGWLRT